MNVSIFWREDRDSWFLIWTDPITGRRKRKSARTTIRRDAERAAIKQGKELDQRGGMGVTTWGAFRIRFEDEHLPTLKKATRENYHHALNKFERLIGSPRSIADINSSLLSEYQAKLRRAKLRPASIASNLRFVKSALAWAHKTGLIPRVPPVIMPALATRRGRPVTLLEFSRFLTTIRRNEPTHADALIRLCKGLWLSGLRLSEALLLKHDRGPIRLHLDQPRPTIDFQIQKSGKQESVPITPDFARFLRRDDCRTGLVFPVALDQSTIGKRLSEYGRLSGVRVSDEKHLTAHDLRRTFGQRWALRLHPMILQRLMRHSSIETTLRFYVDLDSSQVADQLWGDHEKQPKKRGFRAS